jgi:hypothetical protein
MEWSVSSSYSPVVVNSGLVFVNVVVPKRALGAFRGVNADNSISVAVLACLEKPFGFCADVGASIGFVMSEGRRSRTTHQHHRQRAVTVTHNRMRLVGSSLLPSGARAGEV